MSVAGILGTSFSNSQSVSHTNYQFQNSEFQQLGQDLASGNLSAAQSDFATLQQNFKSAGSVPSSSSSNPVSQAFQQLSTDLKSGNLSAAQKDYSTIQGDLNSTSRHLRNHHLPRTGDGPGQDNFVQESNSYGASASTNPQSASSTSAQQVYATLQQELQQSALGSGSESAENLTSDPVSFLA